MTVALIVYMNTVTPLVHWNLQPLHVSTDHQSAFHNRPHSKVWILCRWSVHIFDFIYQWYGFT